MNPAHPYRKTLTLVGALVLISGFVSPGLAQDEDEPKVYHGAEVVDVSLPDIVEIDLRDMPAARQWQPGDPIKEIPRRTSPRPELANFEPPTATRDPLIDRQKALAPDVKLGDVASRGGRFPGQGFSGVQPPDPVGDVGILYYIQMINGPSGARIQVYDKNTQLPILANPVDLDVLGTGVCANGLGDPIVLYDPLAARWLLAEFATSANTLCVYVSRTPNIAQGFYAYQFQAPNFPDYPKFSVWPDGYYMTTNEFTFGQPTPAIYALERPQMLIGGVAQMVRRTAPALAGFNFQALTPGDVDGTGPPANAPAIFMRHRDDEVHNAVPNPMQDFLELWLFAVNWANPPLSTFTGPTNIAVSEFDSTLCGLVSFSCFQQPGTFVRLDPLREVIMWRLQYRNFSAFNIEVLAGNFVTDVGGDQGGIRWFQLTSTNGGPWTLFDEGTYAPDSDNRWMGSAAFDQFGNFAVGYNVSSTNTFPSLRLAGRTLGMPPGTLVGDVTIAQGLASNTSNRYGDYNSMNVDPVDDCTFWFTGEYNPAPQWSTEIFSFKFAQCP